MLVLVVVVLVFATAMMNIIRSIIHQYTRPEINPKLPKPLNPRNRNGKKVPLHRQRWGLPLVLRNIGLQAFEGLKLCLEAVILVGGVQGLGFRGQGLEFFLLAV